MKRMNIKTLLIAGAAALTLPVAAAAQEACTVYTVKQGDTLGVIAETAYGSFDYQQIFNANRNQITNPNSIEVGTVLQLPCADGSLPNAASAQEIIAQQEARQASTARTSSSFEPPIKIVSANGWEPYVGERFNGGGMMMRIATTALNRGGNSRDYNVSFVDDWGAHLTTLLPLGAFDISIAWYIPDCSKVDQLSPGMQIRCTEYDATLPVYETVVGHFTAPDNQYANVRAFGDYAGARICRPEGFFTHDLEEQGLFEPVVTMVRPRTTDECFALMRSGEVDVVPLELETVALARADFAIGEDEMIQNPYLSSLISMSFVAHKTNPRGKVYIAMFNRGLTEMRETGEWYAIISDSLAEFNAMMN